MSLIKTLLCASLASVLTITVPGQDKAGADPECPQGSTEVERKDDRFSGEATVKLKSRQIDVTTPGQQLKVALEYKIKPKGRGRVESFLPEMLSVVFTSTSAQRIYKGEPTLIFLADGERVRPVPVAVHDDYSRLSSEKIVTQTVFTGMTAETLRRISRAKEVQMKLGDTEVKLKAEVLDAIRLFAACALGNK